MKPISIMLNITGSATGARWTKANRGWNFDLFRYGNQIGWGFLGNRWLDPCLPDLNGGTIIVHACLQANGPTDAYPMRSHADGWTERNFGPFSALTDRKVLVYPGGLYKPSLTCGRDMAYCAAYFGFGNIEPCNEVALDAFAGAPENIAAAGNNWPAFKRQCNSQYHEPWLHDSLQSQPCDGIIRSEAEWHRNNDRCPAWAVDDTKEGAPPVYCIIDDYSPYWSGMNHNDRVLWTLNKCREVYARSPNHNPVLNCICASPDTGRSHVPDVLKAWAVA